MRKLRNEVSEETMRKIALNLIFNNIWPDESNYAKEVLIEYFEETSSYYGHKESKRMLIESFEKHYNKKWNE